MTGGARPASPPFLPMTREEMRALGWNELDVLLITGDAYVDHPAFGTALVGRWLTEHGFRTGIVAQPGWQDAADVERMGRPRLFVGITAGAVDSLLAHYTAFRKKRHDDAYTPGGKAGARPNRACLVYANLARRAFPGLPVVLGGIEASLRRITHYDFWTDALRRSILLDAKADLLVWGMGERAALETARLCAAGRPLTHIYGTAWAGRAEDVPENAPVLDLPSHEAMLREPRLLMEAALKLERQTHRPDAWAVQPLAARDEGAGRAIILAPPAPPLSTEELDRLYGLPFRRAAHPSYTAPIPAAEMLRTSITSHRGCGGGCSFCSLALHQGRRIASRSEASIVAEAQAMAARPDFSGSISDVGGPTANMWQARCALEGAPCRRVSCCHPKPCKSFIAPQKRHVALLRKLRALPGVRHVRVASGVRPDLMGEDADVLRAYAVEFAGGQLKTAPEHCADAVLNAMRKPPLEAFEHFLEAFRRENLRKGREQYVVPYLMSAFPGCADEDMYALARWLKLRRWSPRQVQCFVPTPGTVAAAMYYAGVDEHGRSIPVARTDAERLRQHRILIPSWGRETPSPAPPECNGGNHAGRRGKIDSPGRAKLFSGTRPGGSK